MLNVNIWYSKKENCDEKRENGIKEVVIESAGKTFLHCINACFTLYKSLLHCVNFMHVLQCISTYLSLYKCMFYIE